MPLICENSLVQSLSLCQAAVIRQDSFLELYMLEDPCHASSAHAPSRDAVPEGGVSEGTQGDLAQLQCKYDLLQEEVMQLRAAQDKNKKSKTAQNQAEKQFQKLRIKDTTEAREPSQDTTDHSKALQENGDTVISPRADSPRGESLL